MRYVDYLSTVSGGGFVGSWLVGNVKNSQHWLGRLTCWDESIAHLRAYSNYLAPRTGILSADTWTIVASWVRNTFLIQLTSFSWMLTLLTMVLVLRFGFLEILSLTAKSAGASWLPWIVASMGALVTSTLLVNFFHVVKTGKGALGARWIRNIGVLPAWIGAFFVTVTLCSSVRQSAPCGLGAWTTYSKILEHAWESWVSLLIFYVAAIGVIAASTLCMVALERKQGTPVQKKATLIALSIWRALLTSVVCVAVLYLGLCAVFYLFQKWTGSMVRISSYAFVFGPALVLAVFGLSIVLLIGVSGRNSNEAQREWWTRFGTWIAIYAGLGLALSGIAVFGPRLVQKMSTGHLALEWGTVAGWFGTVITGLLSGKSSKTSGEDSKSPVLNILAKIGGLVFILGAVVLTATTLYLFLLNVGTDFDFSHNYWEVIEKIPFSTLMWTLVVILTCAFLFSWFIDINIFSLNQFYRNRIVRCYLGATRWAPGFRRPNPFTKFDFKDDMPLGDLGKDFRGPFPIFGCSLNLAGSSDLALHTRHSASFSLTPLRCGSDRPKVGYAPTVEGNGGFADGVMLGQAVSISGAAASPNMGYNTSPLVAFLLTMFNVRLGWWFPNPGQKKWMRRGMRFSLYYLTQELLGIADEKRFFLNVSDGGHFENLAIYELVRRRCKVIIACDAECDELLQFGGLGNVIRLCETDFGAVIDIDVRSIRQQKEGNSLGHCTVGKIKYSNGSTGYLLYVKASITGDEDVSVAQYRATHPSFPHETTADQFFGEDQFESYRKLGQHIVRHAFRGYEPGEHPVAVAERLADVLAPAGCNSEAFLKHSRALDKIWDRFRSSNGLANFLDELMGRTPISNKILGYDEFCIGSEMLQLMEDVFMDLRMDDFWDTQTIVAGPCFL